MLPSEPEPQLPQPDDSDRAVPTPPPAPHKKWVPTAEALEKLLALFSSDPHEASEEYELARRRLVRFFERHAVRDAERCADKSLDRAMRRIDKGIVPPNLMASLYTIAGFIRKEEWDEEEKMRKALGTLPTSVPPKQSEKEKTDARESCLDRCLQKLPPESRTLILTYYENDGPAKIEQHTDMAEGLGITLNALRLRVHRVRASLEACGKKCMDQVTSAELRATKDH